MREVVSTEDIEFSLFIEAINRRYGYDFSGYAEASLRRRVRSLQTKLNLPSVASLSAELLHKPELFAASLPDFTVTTSELFRDPKFYLAFRTQVAPVLATYPGFKIWHAGCSTGQEVYSLAILLKEVGLYDRAVIYATDINRKALHAAKEGIYRCEDVKGFTANYQASGGCEDFSRYYTVAYNAARFDPDLRRNVVFAAHNLVTDEVFSEVQVILCRNVFIYFDRGLQSRVLSLFNRSLVYKGFLCLGSKETVRFMKGGEAFEELSGGNRIFRKMANDPVVRAGDLL